MTNTANPSDLTRTAFDILAACLEDHGNTLSQWHRAALFELVETFTGYTSGELQGRRAFPLPTGMGKTTAVVAFLAALHRQGCMVPVSVAASKVEALCRMKRDLLALGVPEALIGLKHAQPGASEPSTGNESRLFQLVTHARVRSGRDFDLFGSHEGADRPLCVYDETLLRADSFAFSELSLRMALGALAPLVEAVGAPLLAAMLAYVQECSRTITEALQKLRAEGDPDGQGADVELPFLDEGTLAGYRTALAAHASRLRGWDASLDSLLAMSQESLRVLRAEQGGGIVSVREAVPPRLRNVVVLDASTPIRELARLDPTIRPVESFELASLKSFEAVEVHQLLTPGGRSTVEWSYSAARREAAAVSKEVADIIRAGWATERAFLVFSFVRRGSVDLTSELRKDLAREGIDLTATTPVQIDGRTVLKSRVEFLTWGQHEGWNGFEHCTSVIMAGVLHRSHLDLAAAVKGQTGSMAEPTTSKRLRELVQSEIAHCLYQGASRGSCRRVTNGKAQPMRLWFLHRNPGIKTILDRVMPGAVWSYPEPKHLKKATANSKAAQLLGQLLAHLQGLPETTQKVSSRALKDAMGLEKDEATKKAFTRTLELLDLTEHGWRLDGRSLLRGAAAYGFAHRS